MGKGIFILPEPKEYEIYSTEEMMAETEKMFERTTEIYAVVGREKEKYQNKINSLLQLKRKPEEVLQLLNDETGELLCAHDGEFQTFRILCHIANCEEELGEPSVFQNVTGISDSCVWFQKRVFEIRKLELEWIDDEELTKLIELVSQKKISYICLAEIVHKGAIARKVQTADNLARYLHRMGVVREALLFLVWLDKLLPNGEKKVMSFTNTFLEMGQIRLAYEELLKYQNPDEPVREMQRALLGLL